MILLTVLAVSAILVTSRNRTVLLRFDPDECLECYVNKKARVTIINDCSVDMEYKYTLSGGDGNSGCLSGGSYTTRNTIDSGLQSCSAKSVRICRNGCQGGSHCG